MMTQMGQPKSLSILLVEDDRHYRSDLRTRLGRDYTIVGEASSVETAISLTAQRHPDLMLLDLKLAYGDDGLALLRQLQERQEKVKPLVLSAYQEGSRILRALEAGAMGYIFKFQVGKQLEDALTTVSRGGVYLPPEVAKPLFQVIQTRPTSTTQSETCPLSYRELEVLQLLVKGLLYKHIAKELNIHLGTVKFYCENIRNKLQVENIKQAIAKAIKLEIVQL